MTSSSLISPHEKHGPLKRTFDEVSPTHLPSPIKKEYIERPLPSVESRPYNPDHMPHGHVRFGDPEDPDRTPRNFDFRIPYPTQRSPPPSAGNKVQEYGTSCSGGCMSDCAIVEFRIKSDDHEITFKGTKKSLTTLLDALPEIANFFPPIG